MICSLCTAATPFYLCDRCNKIVDGEAGLASFATGRLPTLPTLGRKTTKVLPSGRLVHHG